MNTVSSISGTASPQVSLPPALPSWTPARQVIHVEGLLDSISALTGQSGALVVYRNGRAQGSVLVQKGRICWAMAEGMQARLTDLLRDQADLSADLDFEAFYRDCVARKKPIGEAFVEQGWLSEEGFCRALRGHTAEAIERLCGQSEFQTRWYPHRRNDYDARFTFGPWEMLAKVVARVYPLEAARVERQLRIAPANAIAFAFLNRPGLATPLPIAVREAENSGETDPRPVGEWASHFQDLIGYIDATSSLVAAITPTGENAVTWREGAFLYVVVCPDPPAMARLIRAHRVERSRS